MVLAHVEIGLGPLPALLSRIPIIRLGQDLFWFRLSKEHGHHRPRPLFEIEVSGGTLDIGPPVPSRPRFGEKEPDCPVMVFGEIPRRSYEIRDRVAETRQIEFGITPAIEGIGIIGP